MSSGEAHAVNRRATAHGMSGCHSIWSPRDRLRTGRALYKTLLTACNNFPAKAATGGGISSTLRTLVKYRYRRDRNLQNPKQIQDALVYGRNSLSTLRQAASGDRTALDTLRSSIASSLATAKIRNEAHAHTSKDLGNYAPHVLKKKQYIEWVTDPKTYAPGPKTIGVWDRPAPLDRLEGKERKVPVYFTTQGLAFLRYYKKQPYRLSLYIRGQARRSEKHWETVSQMDYLIELGKLEDKWDALLHKTGLLCDEDIGASWYDPGTGVGGSWTDAARDQRKKYRDMITADDRKRFNDAKRLMDIHFAEKRLAEKEQMERLEMESAAARSEDQTNTTA